MPIAPVIAHVTLLASDASIANIADHVQRWILWMRPDFRAGAVNVFDVMGEVLQHAGGLSTGVAGIAFVVLPWGPEGYFDSAVVSIPV